MCGVNFQSTPFEQIDEMDSLGPLRSLKLVIITLQSDEADMVLFII